MALNRYFQTIIDHIISGECVLMLGPDLAKTPDGQLISQSMPDYFKGNASLKFDGDGLIHFQDVSDKLLYYTELKGYYQKFSEPDGLHQMLARIPFHLTVSTTPQHVMRRAYEEYGIEHRFGYFSKSRATEGIDRPPSANSPVLYNLFGSLSDNDSLILTNDDLFDFLFAVVGRSQPMPKEVLKSIQGAKVFVFLGFNFEQWFLKLIMRFFRLHEAPLPLVPEETFAGSADTIKSFYIENFKLKMLEQNPEDFIRSIYEAFEAGVTSPEGKNIGLREIQAAKEHPLAKQVRELVKSDKLEDVFELLSDHEDAIDAYDEELLTTIDIQSSRHSRLQKNVDKGKVSEADANMEMNKITDALLGIASGLKAMPE